MVSKQRLRPASAIHGYRLRWGREKERERESVSGKKDNTERSKRLLHHPASQTLTPRYVLLLYHTTQMQLIMKYSHRLKHHLSFLQISKDSFSNCLFILRLCITKACILTKMQIKKYRHILCHKHIN